MALEPYLAAARRSNTRLACAQVTRHFEQDWGGLLTATPSAIAEYLTHYTGRQLLAALVHWSTQQGFADPTKDTLVRQTFKGIRPA